MHWRKYFNQELKNNAINEESSGDKGSDIDQVGKEENVLWIQRPINQYLLFMKFNVKFCISLYKIIVKLSNIDRKIIHNFYLPI